jgi:hypothetical protein
LKGRAKEERKCLGYDNTNCFVQGKEFFSDFTACPVYNLYNNDKRLRSRGFGKKPWVCGSIILGSVMDWID